MMYEKDDGPLTEEEIQKIRETSPASAIEDSEFTERLFAVLPSQ